MSTVISPSSQDISLETLLRDIGGGRIQLPEFQRGWTWDDNRIRAILASLTQGYPMGAIMRLECGGNVNFKARLFEGVDKQRAASAAGFLILDGQQRLTSIYRAACAKEAVDTKTDKDQPIRRVYYLDIKKCLDPAEDRFDAVISVPEDRIVKAFGRTVLMDISSREKEFELSMFPVNIIFDSNAREDWADGYKDFHNNTKECKDSYKQFRAEVLNIVTGYSLPVITLDNRTPKDAVCKVFENVNTGGVSLTVFELVTASFAADDFDLRKDWREVVRPAIHGDKEQLATDIMQAVDEKAFLTAVTLYASHEKRMSEGKGAGSSCKRKDVLALTLDDYLKYRDTVIEGFRLARKFLLEQSVFRKKDLPYVAQLVPLACICAFAGASALDHPKVAAALERWFWCGVLGEMYGGPIETLYANDMDDVSRAIAAVTSGSSEAVAVRTADAAFFSAPRLLTMQTRNSAAYKGVMALVYKAGGKDFRKGTSMDAVLCMDGSPDIHHIFPKDWCDKHGCPKEKRDSIVNKTALLPASNRAIGGAAPSVYSRKIMHDAGISEEDIRSRIESNLIDWNSFISDNFDAHIIARAKLLLHLIEKAMGKNVADKSSDQTCQQFGASLEDSSSSI